MNKEYNCFWNYQKSHTHMPLPVCVAVGQSLATNWFKFVASLLQPTI